MEESAREWDSFESVCDIERELERGLVWDRESIWEWERGREKERERESLCGCSPPLTCFSYWLHCCPYCFLNGLVARETNINMADGGSATLTLSLSTHKGWEVSHRTSRKPLEYAGMLFIRRLSPVHRGSGDISDASGRPATCSSVFLSLGLGAPPSLHHSSIHPFSIITPSFPTFPPWLKRRVFCFTYLLCLFEMDSFFSHVVPFRAMYKWGWGQSKPAIKIRRRNN